MNVYEGTADEDMLLCAWYEQMARADELGEVFARELHPLSSFLLSWRPGGRRALVYEADDRGIWFASWWEGFFSGAAFGIWVRPDHRTPETAEEGWTAFDLTIAIAFQHFPVLVAMTKNPRIVNLATYVGFVALGAIPGLFDGADATVLFLTPEAYGERRRRRHGGQQEPRRIH